MCFWWQAPLVGKMLCLDEMPQVIGDDDQGKPVCGWVGIKNVWRLSGAFAQKQGVKVHFLMWSYESTHVELSRVFHFPIKGWLKSHSSESWSTDYPVVYVIIKGCLFGREFVIMTNRISANLGGVSSEERHTTGIHRVQSRECQVIPSLCLKKDSNVQRCTLTTFFLQHVLEPQTSLMHPNTESKKKSVCFHFVSH